MIPYVEIRDKYTLDTVALVEAQECWFELSYYEVGEFEIFCRASKANLNALQKGRYVTLPNKRFIWVITAVRYTFTAGGSRMISATGYEAKWLLSKRCILKPKELGTNVNSSTIGKEIYALVDSALGSNADAARKITDNNGNQKFFTASNYVLGSVVGMQAPRGNLLEFVNNLLKSKYVGSIVEFINGTLVYKLFEGQDKQRSVKFTQSLDNLLSSEYFTDDSEVATYAQVVSTFDEGEDGNKHKVDYIQEVNSQEKTGIDRAEIVIESNLATKYEDANGNDKETTPDSPLYKGWQTQEGKNALAEHITIEEINGEIDLANSKYVFDDDFFIGDKVRVQDEYFNFFVDVRITKYTFKQDANGYGEEAEYGGTE